MLGVLITLVFLTGDLIKAPTVVPNESGTILVSNKNGTRRWSADWTMEPAERQGRKAIRFTERGRGRVSDFPGEVQWSIEAWWAADANLQFLESEKVVKTSTGAILATERKRFDHNKGVVNFDRNESGKNSKKKSISAPPDTLAVEGIAGVLRFLPFDRSNPFEAHLLTNEPSLYRVTFEKREKSRVKTPAGEFDAYRIEVVPHLGLLDVFRSLAPKTEFWFTAASPHFWVRYEGPENGPGTPDIVMELTAYRR